jgi:hypothetical protein
MIQAYLGMGASERDAQRIALQAAQENRINQMLPLQVEMEKSRLETARLQRETALQALAQNKDLAPLERQKLIDEIAGRQASTALTGVQMEAARARIQADKTMAPLEKEKALADLERTRVLTEDVGKSRAERAKQFEQTHVDMVFPDGTTAKVPAAQVSQEILKGATIDEEKAFRRQDVLQQRQRQATEDERKAQERAQEAEAVILGTNAKGQPNYTNPAIQTQIDAFNASSDKPYMYGPPTPGRLYGTNRPAKIPLADPQGKPLKARIVYQGWLEYQQTHGEIPLEEYVNKVVRRK